MKEIARTLFESTTNKKIGKDEEDIFECPCEVVYYQWTYNEKIEESVFNAFKLLGEV